MQVLFETGYTGGLGKYVFDIYIYIFIFTDDIVYIYLIYIYIIDISAHPCNIHMYLEFQLSFWNFGQPEAILKLEVNSYVLWIDFSCQIT